MMHGEISSEMSCIQMQYNTS